MKGPFEQPAPGPDCLAPPFAPAALAKAFPPVASRCAAHLQHSTWPSLPAETPSEAATGKRRRKLWELPADFHWPLIGACFDCDDLRRLVTKHLPNAPKSSDFVLHIMVADACSTRTTLAELIQKQLDARHATIIRAFSAANDPGALKAHWQEALHGRTRIPGALWAGWTHPSCDEGLEHDIHGDIHMAQLRLAHQDRRQAIALQDLQAANRQLTRALEASQHDRQGLQAARTAESQTRNHELASLRSELAGRDGEIATLKRQLQAIQNASPSLSDLNTYAWRAELAESRLAESQARQANLETELARRRLNAKRPAAPAAVEPPAPQVEPLAPVSLAGRCVLCVGGRSGAVDSYRQAVEARGGRFLHHDGGQEESPHRINAALSAADLVICQAGCISHNAYWRVKSQCKRSGKPCLFVKNPGISSFDRLFSEACVAGSADQTD